jgi:hypothetical protein
VLLVLVLVEARLLLLLLASASASAQVPSLQLALTILMTWPHEGQPALPPQAWAPSPAETPLDSWETSTSSARPPSC